MSHFTKYIIFICVFLIHPHFVFSDPIFKNFKSSDPNRKKICLNMIVKDESNVIRRCLDSAIPIIDYWVIVDTGSKDNTQQIIKDYMKERGIPGELHEKPWKNFCHNRNEAFGLARDKADFVFFLDADDFVSYNEEFKLPELNKDCYFVKLKHQFGSFTWKRILLVSTSLDWNWAGVLHESLQIPKNAIPATLDNAHVVCTTEGARSQDPQKYQKDAQILEEGLKKEPNNSHYVFYLAQSYENAQDDKKALENYQKRVEMGGWDQEVFIAQMRIGGIHERLGANIDTIVASYRKAIETRRNRVEPYYRISHYYRRIGEFEKAYQVAKIGSAIPPSTDIICVEEWMYEYGIFFELTLNAYLTKRYQEAQDVGLKILSNPNLPSNVYGVVENNLGFVNQKLLEVLLVPEP